jgi:hypothetical protein
MTNRVTYTTTNLAEWNETRRGEIELDAVARAYLGNPEITDRDRIAFALRELRKRGYDVEARPVDWTRPLMICSVEDSMLMAFGELKPSSMYRRLERMAQTSRLVTEETFPCLVGELYGDEKLYDSSDFLEEAYEFTFKGDPALVESVFQAVGFATQHGLLIPDDGSETHHLIKVAQPTMVIA